eukprot:Sspe_Gene.59649::Locus_32774_Transcript_1_1_Confidence_1.000_Length_8035::g.59649::m.59649
MSDPGESSDEGDVGVILQEMGAKVDALGKKEKDEKEGHEEEKSPTPPADAKPLENQSSEAKVGNRTVSFDTHQLKSGEASQMTSRSSSPAAPITEFQRSHNSMTRALAAIAISQKSQKQTPEQGAAKAIFKLKGLVGRRRAQQENDTRNQVTGALENLQADVNRTLNLRRHQTFVRRPSVGSGATTPVPKEDDDDDEDPNAPPRTFEQAMALVRKLEDRCEALMADIDQREQQLVCAAELGLQTQRKLDENDALTNELEEEMEGLREQISALERDKIKLGQEIREANIEHQKLKTQLMYLQEVEKHNEELQKDITEKQDIISKMDLEARDQKDMKWAAKTMLENMRKHENEIKKEKERLEEEKVEMEKEAERKAAEKAKEHMEKMQKMQQMAIAAFKAEKQKVEEERAEELKRCKQEIVCLKEEVELLQQSVKEKAEECADLEKAMSSLKDAMVSKEDEYMASQRQLKSDAAQKLAEEQAAAEKRYEEKCEELRRQREALKEAETREEQLQAEIAKLDQTINLLQETSQKTSQRMKTLQDDTEESQRRYNDELRRVTAMRDDLSRELAGLRSALEDKERQLLQAKHQQEVAEAELQKKVGALKEEKELLAMEVDDLKGAVKRKGEEAKHIESSLTRDKEALAAEVGDLKAQLKRADGRIEELKQQLVDAQLSQQGTGRGDVTSQELDDLRSELTRTINTLKQEKASLESRIEDERKRASELESSYRKELRDEQQRLKEAEDRHTAATAKWKEMIETMRKQREKEAVDLTESMRIKQDDAQRRTQKLTSELTDEREAKKQLQRELDDAISSHKRTVEDMKQAAARAEEQMRRSFQEEKEHILKEREALARREAEARTKLQSMPTSLPVDDGMASRWKDMIEKMSREHEKTVQQLQEEFKRLLEVEKEETKRAQSQLAAERERVQVMQAQVAKLMSSIEAKNDEIRAMNESAGNRVEQVVRKFESQLEAEVEMRRKSEVEQAHLRDKMREAEATATEKHRKQQSEIWELQLSIKDANKMLETEKGVVTSLQGQLAEAQKAISALKASIASSEASSQEGETALRNELREMTARVKQLELEHKRAISNVEQQKQTIATLEKKLDEAKEQLRAAQAEARDSDRKARTAEGGLAALEEKYKALLMKFEKAEAACARHISDLDDERRAGQRKEEALRTELEAVRAQITKVQAEAEAAAGRLKRELESKEALVEKSIADCNGKEQQLARELRQAQERESSLEERLNLSESRARQLATLLEEERDTSRSCKDCISALTAQLEVLQREIDESQAAYKKARHDRQAAVEECRKQKSRANQLEAAMNQVKHEAAKEFTACEMQLKRAEMEVRHELATAQRLLEDEQAVTARLHHELQEAAEEASVAAAQAAKRHRQLEAQLDEAKDREALLLRDLRRAEEQEGGTKVELSEVRQRVAELELELQRQRAAEAHLKIELSELLQLQREAMDSAEHARVGLESDLMGARAEQSSVRRQLDRYNTEIEEAKVGEVAAAERASAAEARALEAEQKASTARAEVASLQRRLGASLEQLDEAKEELSTLQRKHRELQASLDSRQREALSSTRHREDMAKECDRLRKQAEDAEEAERAHRAKAKELELRLGALQMELQTEALALGKRDADTKDLEAQLASSESKRLQLQQELHSARAEANSMLNRVDKLAGEAEAASRLAAAGQEEVEALRLELSEAQRQLRKARSDALQAAGLGEEATVRLEALERELQEARDDSMAQRREAARLRRTMEQERATHGIEMNELQRRAAAAEEAQSFAQLSPRRDDSRREVQQLHDELREVRSRATLAEEQVEQLKADLLRAHAETREALASREMQASSRERLVQSELEHERSLRESAESGMQRYLSTAERNAIKAGEADMVLARKQLELDVLAGEVRDLKAELRRGEETERGLRDKVLESERRLAEAHSQLQSAQRQVEQLEGRLSEESSKRRDMVLSRDFESDQQSRSVQRLRSEHQDSEAALRSQLRGATDRVKELERELQDVKQLCRSQTVQLAAAKGGREPLELLSRFDAGLTQQAAEASSLNIASMKQLEGSRHWTSDLDRMGLDVNAASSKVGTVSALLANLPEAGGSPRRGGGAASPYPMPTPGMSPESLNSSMEPIPTPPPQVGGAFAEHPVSKALYKAMARMGTDEAALFQALRKVGSAAEWGEVERDFKKHHANFHKGDLVAALKDELTREELLQAQDILHPRAGVVLVDVLEQTASSSSSSSSAPVDNTTAKGIAKDLLKAMDRLGTDEDLIYSALRRVKGDGHWRDVIAAFAAHPFHRGDLRSAFTSELSAKELAKARGIVQQQGGVWWGDSAAAAAVAGTLINVAAVVLRKPMQPTEEMAQRLYGAMKGFGTNERAVYNELSRVQGDEGWRELLTAFAAAFPKFHHGNLYKALRSELNKKELERARHIVESSGGRWEEETYSPPSSPRGDDAMVHTLYKAMKGLGTSEGKVYGVLSEVQGQEGWERLLRRFREEYPKFHQGDLYRALADELNAKELEKAKGIIEGVGAVWEPPPPSAKELAHTLHKAMKGFTVNKTKIEYEIRHVTTQQAWDDLVEAYKASEGSDLRSTLRSKMGKDLAGIMYVLQQRGVNHGL